MADYDLSAFEAGSGLGAETTTAIFASAILPLMAFWSVWVIYRGFRGWANGRLTTWDLCSVGLQSFVVLTVTVVILT